MTKQDKHGKKGEWKRSHQVSGKSHFHKAKGQSYLANRTCKGKKGGAHTRVQVESRLKTQFAVYIRFKKQKCSLVRFGDSVVPARGSCLGFTLCYWRLLKSGLLSISRWYTWMRHRTQPFLFVWFWFWFCFETVFLCTSGCPEARSVDQAGLQLSLSRSED